MDKRTNIQYIYRVVFSNYAEDLPPARWGPTISPSPSKRYNSRPINLCVFVTRFFSESYQKIVEHIVFHKQRGPSQLVKAASAQGNDQLPATKGTNWLHLPKLKIGRNIQPSSAAPISLLRGFRSSMWPEDLIR
jgi:hypothetical protein